MSLSVFNCFQRIKKFRLVLRLISLNGILFYVIMLAALGMEQLLEHIFDCDLREPDPWVTPK